MNYVQQATEQAGSDGFKLNAFQLATISQVEAAVAHKRSCADFVDHEASVTNLRDYGTLILGVGQRIGKSVLLQALRSGPHRRYGSFEPMLDQDPQMMERWVPGAQVPEVLWIDLDYCEDPCAKLADVIQLVFEQCGTLRAAPLIVAMQSVWTFVRGPNLNEVGRAVTETVKKVGQSFTLSEGLTAQPAQKDPQFPAVGDLVMLKSGGPTMTVLQVEGTACTCSWDHEEGRKTDVFEALTLVPV